MLVVDTSVAVKWVVPENPENIEAATDIALSLLTRGLLAPDCMLAEFANAMFKKVRRAEIPQEQARQSVAILPSLVSFLPTSALVAPALDLAMRINHPIHDCIFLVMAVQNDLPLITSDEKFVTRCRADGATYPIHSLAERSWL
ncbi:MAG: hypothetical protein RLZZ58_567 [Pseudomonadota bacterium]